MNRSTPANLRALLASAAPGAASLAGPARGAVALERSSPLRTFLNLGCATILGGFLAGSAPAALVAHWAFDEGSGNVVADSSGFGNNGTFYNTPTWDSDGVRGTFLTFNGQDSAVSTPFKLPVMTTSNDFSWSVWAKANEAGNLNQQSDSVIVGNRYSNEAGTEFSPRQFIKLTPSKFEWHQNGNGNDNLDYPDMEVDGWHHFAIVKEGTTLTIYIDGDQVSSGPLTEGVGSVEHPFFIGGTPGASGGNAHREFFNGSIDDVRLYDHALSSAEVRSLVPEPGVALLGMLGGLCLLRRSRR